MLGARRVFEGTMTGQQLTTFVFYTQFVTSASFDVGDQVTSSSNTSFFLFYLRPISSLFQTIYGSPCPPNLAHSTQPQKDLHEHRVNIWLSWR